MLFGFKAAWESFTRVYSAYPPFADDALAESGFVICIYSTHVEQNQYTAISRFSASFFWELNTYHSLMFLKNPIFWDGALTLLAGQDVKYDF